MEAMSCTKSHWNLYRFLLQPIYTGERPSDSNIRDQESEVLGLLFVCLFVCFPNLESGRISSVEEKIVLRIQQESWVQLQC